jgi:hypothetical protein
MEKDDTSSLVRGSDLLLPVGKLWLWQILSSTLQTSPDGNTMNSGIPEHQQDNALTEVSDVVSSCLQILHVMETDGTAAYYVHQIENGAKLYHLTNTCLYPEEVFQNERIRSQISQLFQAYTASFCDTTATIDSTCRHDTARAYISACFQHSQIISQSKGAKSKKEKEDDAKLLSILEGPSATTNESSISLKDMRALQDFVGDVCDAYMEHGAQYDEFTMCVRFLVHPGFPAQVVSDVIVRLRDILHLLTLEEEAIDPSGHAMATSLQFGFSGGLPSRDGSSRDAGVVLDSMSHMLQGRSSLSAHQGGRRLTKTHGGYFYRLCIGYLARNLICSLEHSESSRVESSWRHRLKGFHVDDLTCVIRTAQFLLSNEIGDKRALAEAVIAACNEDNERHDIVPNGERFDIDDEETWNRIMNSLRN